jgi:D-xylose transport system substrate-binding protein
MTVYKAVKQEAERAAELAVALVRDEEPDPQLVAGTVDNGEMQVPSVLLEPVAVTAGNVAETIVADLFWSVDQICTSRYADACEQAGIG